MSLLDSGTKANLNTAYYGAGGGGGSGSLSTISVSTINMEPNGEFNWDGSLNFQGTNGGYVSIASTINAAVGANGIQITGNTSNVTSSISMYVDATGNAVIEVKSPLNAINMKGANLANVTVNGVGLPVAINPNQTYSYVTSGGTGQVMATLPAVVSGNWYRLDGTLRIQTSNAVGPQDWVGLGFSGNYNNFGNNMTTSLATVSTLQGDVYQNFSIVMKANNNNAASFDCYGATTIAGFSTSMGLEVPLVFTNLGTF